MAASPRWKVFSPANTYQAACKDHIAAVVLAEWLGDGATVRDGHKHIVYTHDDAAGLSYDEIEEFIFGEVAAQRARVAAKHARCRLKGARR